MYIDVSFACPQYFSYIILCDFQRKCVSKANIISICLFPCFFTFLCFKINNHLMY